MIPRLSEQREAAFGYVGGFLNACYMAGFSRRLSMDHIQNLSEITQEVTDSESGEFFEGETRHLDSKTDSKESSKPENRGSVWKPAFYLQQTNNVNVSIPIFIPKTNVAIPQDTEETKVIGRLIGRRLPSGERTLDIRALQITHPSIKDMPNSAAWNKPQPSGNGAAKDSFRPFFDPNDNEDFKLSPFAKVDRKGRQCLNVAHIAGFLQAFSWARDKEGRIKKDCILMMVRQSANPDDSIPVRLYGSRAESIYKSLKIGLPVLIEGFVRVKVFRTGQKREDGVEIIRTISYLHTSGVLVGGRSVIKVEPPWYLEMRQRMIEDRARQTAEMAKKIQRLTESTPREDDDFEFQ